MTGRGSARRAAQLHCAAAIAAILLAPVAAQIPPQQPPSQTDPAELDPSAPLDPMPDLGVEWPDINSKEQAPAAPATGAQYRFASVTLPGLEVAGADAAKLRSVFAIKNGDPVIAQDVIASGLALKTALGEEGFAEAKIGEQEIEVDHQTHLATLILP